jgi:hypothetical protein
VSAIVVKDERRRVHLLRKTNELVMGEIEVGGNEQKLQVLESRTSAVGKAKNG